MVLPELCCYPLADMLPGVVEDAAQRSGSTLFMQGLHQKVGEETMLERVAFEGLLFRPACREDDASAPLLDVFQGLLREGRGRYSGGDQL